MTPNEKYVDYVTSTSFNLQLSKRMIAALAAIANNDIHGLDPQLWADGGYGGAVPLGDALIRRGLVRHKQPKRCRKGEHPWSVTDEGWLVVDLLKRAGLISEQVVRAAS